MGRTAETFAGEFQRTADNGCREDQAGKEGIMQIGLDIERRLTVPVEDGFLVAGQGWVRQLDTKGD